VWDVKAPLSRLLPYCGAEGKPRTPVTAVAFSPDERWLAFTGKEIPTSASRRAAAFVRRVLRSSRGRPHLPGVFARRTTSFIPPETSGGLPPLSDEPHTSIRSKSIGIRGLAVNRNGHRIEAGCADTQLRMIDLQTCKELWQTNLNRINWTATAPLFSADGSQVLIDDWDVGARIRFVFGIARKAFSSTEEKVGDSEIRFIRDLRMSADGKTNAVQRFNYSNWYYGSRASMDDRHKRSGRR